MKVQNVMKVIDINAKDVNIATWNYLSNFHITYRDEVLKEHLLDIQQAIDTDLRAELPENMLPNLKVIEEEIRQLGVLAFDNDAAYVRFITC